MDLLSKLQAESRERHAEINALQNKPKKRKRRKTGAYKRKPLVAPPKQAPIHHINWEKVKQAASAR